MTRELRHSREPFDPAERGPVMNSSAIEEISGPPLKILVAEDQAMSALMLRRTLERMGHEVTVATDGDQAWRIVQEQDGPSIVISDWMMPGLDGPELCRRIRARGGLRYTYVILLTARDRRADRIEGLRAGADDFLVKPPDADELAVRLEIARRILGVQAELERLNRVLEGLATTDGLTDLCNRREFDNALTTAFSFAQRQQLPLSVLILDVDHFKGFNDEFGHAVGDEILRTVAGILRDAMREHDLVARYGGEEFAVLLPATSAEECRIPAERLRTAIEEHPWPFRPVTVSLGAASVSPSTGSAMTLVEEADQALYRSKRSGRNRLTHYNELTESLAEWLSP
jgi:diguanylate cyclase (GGDEF)-like protein